MDATDIAGAAGAGVLCLAGLSICGLPLVPALMLSAIVSATLIGRIRSSRGTGPPGTR